MATEQISYDYHVTENDYIHVRKITRKLGDGGKELSKSYHRHVILPGDDISKENDKTQKLVMAFQGEQSIYEHMLRIEAAKSTLGADLDTFKRLMEEANTMSYDSKKNSAWQKFKSLLSKGI